ncbi:MAG: hypothetical protein HFJ28_06045, partial [Clostridia bacterium]|nr:hypothetical protein [Clostridia bacterium]
SVTVDGKTETKQIEVTEPATTLEITETQINLYEEEQPDNDDVFNDGIAYTLVRIQINENGTLRNLELSEFDQLVIEDNLDAATTGDRLIWGAYKQDKKTEVTGSTDEVYYIGICAFDRLAELNGKTLTITYPGAEPITLTINSVLANP